MQQKSCQFKEQVKAAWKKTHLFFLHLETSNSMTQGSRTEFCCHRVSPPSQPRAADHHWEQPTV